MRTNKGGQIVLTLESRLEVKVIDAAGKKGVGVGGGIDSRILLVKFGVSRPSLPPFLVHSLTSLSDYWSLVH